MKQLCKTLSRFEAVAPWLLDPKVSDEKTFLIGFHGLGHPLVTPRAASGFLLEAAPIRQRGSGTAARAVLQVTRAQDVTGIKHKIQARCSRARLREDGVVQQGLAQCQVQLPVSAALPQILAE